MTEIRKNEDPCKSTEDAALDGAEAVEAPEKEQSNFGFALLFLVFFVGTMSLPWTLPWLVRYGSSTVVEPLGEVQRVNYLGGFGTWTQVEVPGRVLLLYQSCEVPLGAQVERRRRGWEEQLCVVGTERCCDIASR